MLMYHTIIISSYYDFQNFINEAETMLASPTSPETPFTGNTPGVIGAQEVYK